MEEKKSLIIAIDYDNTYTRDPQFFNAFIQLIKMFGHQPIMVTARPEAHGMDDAPKGAVGHLIPIVFANGGWKKDVARAHGWDVDIWIDDQPQFIQAPSNMREVIEMLRKNKHLDRILAGQ